MKMLEYKNRTTSQQNPSPITPSHAFLKGNKKKDVYPNLIRSVPWGRTPGRGLWWKQRAWADRISHQEILQIINLFITGISHQEVEGYAYILTHPGIPTVFYDHFYDWGDSIHKQIAKLMNIRRQQDIHSRSAIKILEVRSDLYSAIIDNRVCMKIGDGSWCPSGKEWKLATSGHRYAVWHK